MDMRKLFIVEFLSLDGVMQAPGSPDEDPSGGFRHGGWELPYFDDEALAAVNDVMAATGGLLLGRRTYEQMARFWPDQPPEDEFAAQMNRLPKFVASRTLTELAPAWSNSTLLENPVADSIRALKAGDGGDLQVPGSGDLAQTLMAEGLVDDYRLLIHPLVLGSGRRLFRDARQPRPLRLVDVRPSTSGILIATYERVAA
jgi:dihydrofolate reductase